MPVPFLDLSRQNRQVRQAALTAFADIIDANAFIGGPRVEGFERNFAKLCGVPHAVAVNSGTDALRLALLALGLQPGDEVITAPFTFIATTEVISQCGGRIVLADIEPETLTLDPAAVEQAITPRTRGLIPIHLYGQMADMDGLMEVARRHGLWVIEDACQAHGASLDGRPAGSIGAAGAFSFYPTKNMGAFGEGGVVTTADEDLAQQVLALRNHGQSSRYSHEFEGFNARLDAIQAAVLDEKLRHLPEWNAQRQALADRYNQALRGVGDLRLPTVRPGATHVYHLYSVRTARRDDLQRHLKDRGIGTAVHYPIPLHQQRAYQNLGYGPDQFPVSSNASATVLSLPLFQGLTEGEVDEVCRAIREFFAG